MPGHPSLADRGGGGSSGAVLHGEREARAVILTVCFPRTAVGRAANEGRPPPVSRRSQPRYGASRRRARSPRPSPPCSLSPRLPQERSRPPPANLAPAAPGPASVRLLRAAQRGGGGFAGGRETCASGSGLLARSPPRLGRERCRYAAAPAPRLLLGCGLAPR